MRSSTQLLAVLVASTSFLLPAVAVLTVSEPSSAHWCEFSSPLPIPLCMLRKLASWTKWTRQRLCILQKAFAERQHGSCLIGLVSLNN